ncbi:hypothetical protein ACVWZX_004595 [Deinococcus sp. UYEF24]
MGKPHPWSFSGQTSIRHWPSGQLEDFGHRGLGFLPRMLTGQILLTTSFSPAGSFTPLADSVSVT